MIAGSLEIQMAMNLAKLANDMSQSKNIVGGAMREINSAVSTVKTALGALGISFGVGYFVNFLKNTSDTVANMKTLAQEAGTTGASFSRFEAPVRSAGLGMDALAGAIFRSNVALLEARDPQSKAAQALSAIGLSVQNFKGLKPDEIFEMVARSISKYSDGLGKNNVMQELFGKSGREMNRVIAEIAERQQLSTKLTDEQIEEAKRLNDQLLELKMTSESFWRGITSEGVPALNEILKVFNETRKEAGLYEAAIASVSRAFDLMKGNSLEQQLTRVNERIENIQKTTASWKTSGQVEEAKQLNNLLAMRKIIEEQIFDREMADYVKRQEETAKGLKPTVQFDPKATEEARKREIAWQETLGKMEQKRLNMQSENEEKADKDRIERELSWQEMLGKMDLVRLNRQAEAEAKADEDIAKQARRTQEIGRELGMTFASAFEDAVVHGNSFRDVLKGIEQDLIRIAIRRTVTEPAAALFSGWIGSILGGSIFGGSSGAAGGVGLQVRAAGGPVLSGSSYVVGERGPEIFTPSTSGVITPNGGGTTFIQHLNIGGNVTHEDVANATAAGRQSAIAFIAESRRRDPTGPFG